MNELHQLCCLTTAAEVWCPFGLGRMKRLSGEERALIVLLDGIGTNDVLQAA